MKRIHLLGFALVFFSLSASAGHQTFLLAVPFEAVVVGNSLFPPEVNLLKRIDQDQNKRISVRHGKFSSVKKMGFWNRLALKMVPKKYRSQLYLARPDTAEADKKAKTSLILGIAALALAIIPWYTIIAAIPLAIVAISMGSRAQKMGSEKMTGKGFGVAALAIVAVWVILSAIYVAAWAW